ncbi:MAG: thiamine pyrophosphate-binding protein, partial [Humibacter sp.]
MRFHEALARAMKDQGITDVFGIIGDGNLFIIDSFQRVGGGRVYYVSNEASGVLAANGYNRTTGRLGVATVTHGPAFTNTVTALIDNVKSRTPLVLIAGDTAVIERDNLQNIAQREITAPTGAGFEQVRAPETAAEDLATAVHRAWIERRPIVLNVPAEFQWAETEYAPAAPRAIEPQSPVPDPDAVEAATGAIANARRPIVLAGIGAIRPESRDALLRLATRIGAPLATTLQAQGLWAGEPHNLGVFGVSSTGVGLE